LDSSGINLITIPPRNGIERRELLIVLKAI
jgi:hypothetical protein